MRTPTSTPNESVHYERAAVIGRFMPNHREHDRLVDHALSIADEVVVLLGSSFHARSSKNPFTAGERETMLRGSIADADQHRVRFTPVRDYFDDDRWSEVVREAVAGRSTTDVAASRIALVGNFKDASSEYLRLFPGWDVVSTTPVLDIDATSVREVLFTADPMQLPAALGALQTVVSPFVQHFLASWAKLPHYEHLREEHAKVAQLRRDYPYPYSLTADSVVTNGDFILLVRRGEAPGKGLWALPGGYLDPRKRETLLQAALRELTEETKLGLERDTLLRALVDSEIFDHPDRAVTGRGITRAFHFDLKLDRNPEVEGDDDAEEAQWLPIERLRSMESEFHDDHFTIIKRFRSFPSLA